MSDVTIRGTVTNRGIMRLWDLYLSPNIKQYTQDIKDFFATHNIAVEGEDNEVRFIGQENSLTITSDEVNNFVRQQKAKEEHLRAVALYNAALPCINTTGIELYTLGVPRELRLLVNSFVATKPSPSFKLTRN